jgi:hypothetical protein
MIATFAALLFAHVLADFVLRPQSVAKTRPLHGMIVLLTATLATGGASPWLLVLTAAHLAIGFGQRRCAEALGPRSGLAAFLLGQAAHVASLAALAALAPGIWAAGLWAACPGLASLMALAAGLILTTRAGGQAVGLLMEPWAEEAPAGLPGGGRIIGLLERGLIFALLLTGQAGGVGYLVAAKSVLRFGAVGDDRKLSEYVIIGTLASVSWAIVISAAISALLHHLPPLGIPDLTP